MSLGNDFLSARVDGHIRSGISLRQNLSPCIPDVVAAARLLADAFRQGRKLLLCGNGGSAADCQHLATEFVSRLSRNTVRPALPAIALTTDTSFLTAYANDESFTGVFSRQVEALGGTGDVLLGITTSGSSANILSALRTAKERGLKTIALTGKVERLEVPVDVSIAVPSGDTQLIQETHLTLEHSLCDLVECLLYPKEKNS